jgi:rfaE bifunctional protein nucleotidyltransferase chain/domain
MLPSRSPKIIDPDQLSTLGVTARQNGTKIVWTNGCFDLFHFGHLRSLQMARERGDLLIVGVNSDESIRRLKGKDRPIVPLIQRMEIVASLECVHSVVELTDSTPERLIQLLQPHVCCKGTDYAPPNGKPIPELPVVEAYGGEMVFLPLIEGFSTTSLIHRILELHQSSK